jgi:hypothetical protein
MLGIDSCSCLIFPARLLESWYWSSISFSYFSSDLPFALVTRIFWKIHRYLLVGRLYFHPNQINSQSKRTLDFLQCYSVEEGYYGLTTFLLIFFVDHSASSAGLHYPLRLLHNNSKVSTSWCYLPMSLTAFRLDYSKATLVPSLLGSYTGGESFGIGCLPFIYYVFTYDSYLHGYSGFCWHIINFTFVELLNPLFYLRLIS